MFCWDQSSCNMRYATHDYYMSSIKKPWSYDFAQGGIFATDGSSPWGTANRVYVKYCSSDLWSGDVPASAATFGFEFRGSRIVAAVMQDLMQRHGLGSKQGTRLLFGGCSAGAIGAMNNLEAVAEAMPGNVQTWGFLDGAALLDIQPKGWKWTPELEPLQSLMANMSAFTNPQFPAYCATLFPGEEWKCWIGQYRMPLIRSVPYFINAPQFDMFELMYDTDNYRPTSPGQLDFAEEFQTGTLALIASLPHGSGVFSPTCLVHCLSGQTTFVDLVSDDTTLGASLSAWYFSGQDVQAVSSCTGFNCINACGIDLDTGLPCNMNTNGQQCTALSLPVDVGGSTSDSSAPAPSPQAEGIVKAFENSLTPAQQAALGDTIANQPPPMPPPSTPAAAAGKASAPAPGPSVIDMQHAAEESRQNAEQQFHDDQQDSSSAGVVNVPSGAVASPVAAPAAAAGAAAAQAPVSGIYEATSVSTAPAAAPSAAMAAPEAAPAPAAAPEAAPSPAAAMATAPWGAAVATSVAAAASSPASAVVAPASAPAADASATNYRRLMRAAPCAGTACYEQWKA